MLANTHTSMRERFLGRQIRVALLFAALLPAGLAPVAAAQNGSADDSGPPSVQVIVEEHDRDRSRPFLSQSEPGQTTQLIVEKEITVKVRGVQPQAVSCKATVAISYAQLNTIAKVDGTIDNSDCAASSGNYMIAISVRDEDGELNILEFEDSWLRSDSQPVLFEHDYPIGENVELVRVRTRRVSCICAAAPQE